VPPVGQTLLILAVYVLSCSRVTRLINSDVILDPARVWMAHRAAAAKTGRDEALSHGRHHHAERLERATARWNKAVYFVGCPWCVGFWICLAAAYLPVALIGWPWWAVVPVALSASHLVGVASALDTEDMQIEEEKP